MPTDIIIAEDNSTKLVTGSMELVQTMPAVFNANKNSLLNANGAMQAFVNKVQASGGKLNPELDAEAMSLLVKINATMKKMNEHRSPITQIFTSISREFTSIENDLDPKKNGTISFNIQQLRNQYAAEVEIEMLRKQKEAEAKAAKVKEEGEFRAYIKNQITQKLIDYLAAFKTNVTNAFNAITLETFNEKETGLKSMSVVFPQSKLGDIIKYADFTLYRHDSTEANVIRTSEHTGYDFNSFYSQFTQHVKELKESLIDRLPSKKAELVEAAEQLRIAEENEKKRLAEIEKAKGNAKKELEEKLRLEKIAEQERLKIEAEDKLLREQQEQHKINLEAEASKTLANETADLERSSSAANALFDQATDISMSTPAPEVRKGYEIIVTHPAGWVEIFQLWYSKEGVKMGVIDMGKKSLNQMKAWAEALAKKEDVKIESKFLRYEISVKAVNRKEEV